MPIYIHLIIYHRSIYISDVHICLHLCIIILNLAIASIPAIAQFLQFLSILSNISSIPQFLLTVAIQLNLVNIYNYCVNHSAIYIYIYIASCPSLCPVLIPHPLIVSHSSVM